MFQFSSFAGNGLCIQPPLVGMTLRGFPHSEITGSMPAYSSPMLIAVSHVLHRLSVPRHPPRALNSLTKIIRSALSDFEGLNLQSQFA